MARGTQLRELVSMLRAEAGHSTFVSSGIDNLPAQQHLLRRVQTMLYDDYDWPFMETQPYISLNATQRYYDFPSLLDLESVDRVELWYNGQPSALRRGIGPQEFALTNSDNNETGGQVMRWDVMFTGDIDSKAAILEQLEVWPIPDSDGQKLQFYGRRKLRPLIADDDVCDMDDLCIVLVAAAEILLDQESPKAPAVGQAATKRIMQMKGKVKSGTTPLNMARTQPPSYLGRPIIRVR